MAIQNGNDKELELPYAGVGAEHLLAAMLVALGAFLISRYLFKVGRDFAILMSVGTGMAWYLLSRNLLFVGYHAVMSGFVLEFSRVQLAGFAGLFLVMLLGSRRLFDIPWLLAIAVSGLCICLAFLSCVFWLLKHRI